jgi:glucose/arabinose dehydrogenase
MRSFRGVFGVTFAALALSLLAPSTASAVRLVRVARSFDAPVHVAAPPGAQSGTLYVVEQEGQIWRWRAGTRRLFLDLRSSVSCCGERGLLSVAFDPRWQSNRFLYVNYTNNSGDTRVARFQANSTFTRAVVSSRRILLALDQPFSNHNGGQLAFGPNGRLYTGQGDGGSSCDPAERAQNMRSRHGKLLSMDTDAIGAGWRIDGLGLRNPWRFSFDRVTGRLYLADVGQNDAEEVNTRRAGLLGGDPENYGWDVFEGRAPSGCENSGLSRRRPLVGPISVYSHAEGCSVTGGFAYRGGALDGLRGWYVFGDYCSGRIWRLLYRNGKLVRARSLLLDTSLNVSSFGEGARGELYVVHHGGSIWKLVRS